MASDNQQSGDPLATANGQLAADTKSWATKWLSRRFESTVDVTFGHGTSIYSGFPMGSSNEIVTGGSMSLMLDPTGWIDDDRFQKLQDLLAPMGEWSGVFGASRELHYGPKVEIHHGAHVERRGVQSFDASNPRTHFLAGIITASTALSVLGWKKQNADGVIWEQLSRQLGPRGVTGALLNLLIEYEKGAGKCDAGQDRQNEASSLTDQASSVKSDYADLLLDLASTATDQGSTLAADGQADQTDAQNQANASDESVSDAENAAESDDSGGAADEESDEDQPSDSPDTSDLEFGSDEANYYESCDGVRATNARHVSIRARAVEDDDTDPSMIHLDAVGSDGDDNGVIALNSTGQATIVCGPAAVQVKRSAEVGQIDLITGDEGTITLNTGGESGSTAVMTPDGIKLSVGAEDAGAVISMTADGIKLSVGADGGPCLELTTSGVTMSCGAASVAVDESDQTTSAMNISQTADVDFTAEGAMATLKGSGQATINGAVAMIN